MKTAEKFTFRKESDFLHFIRKLMEMKGHIAIPQNSFIDPRRNNRYLPGTPDLIICSRDGRFVGLELKLAGNKLTNSQEQMRMRFENTGLADSFRVVYPEDYQEVLADLL